MTARSEDTATDGLAVVEKYEAFVAYLYPILQSCPRKHGVLRDVVLALLFEPVGGLYHAAKSKQVSRLHAVDAEFATLRSHLRFMVRDGVRILTPHQHRTALALMAEPGKMLGAWINRLSNRSGTGRSPRPEGQAGS